MKDRFYSILSASQVSPRISDIWWNILVLTHDKTGFYTLSSCRTGSKMFVVVKEQCDDEEEWSIVVVCGVATLFEDNCLVVRGITITMLDMMAFVTNQYTERLLHSVWIWWTDTLQIASLGCLASFHTMAAHLGGVSTYTSRMMIVALVYLCM